MEEGGKREFKVREAGVYDPPVPLYISGKIKKKNIDKDKSMKII